MKKRYLILLAVGVIVFVRYNAQMVAQDQEGQSWWEWLWSAPKPEAQFSSQGIATYGAAGAARAATAGSPRESTPLSLYRTSMSEEVPNINRIEEFLNEQIKDAGLNPTDFSYSVGDRWLVFKRNLGGRQYGLVIPSEATGAINVVNLGSSLADPAFSSSKLFNKYRLEVIEALVTARVDEVFTPQDGMRFAQNAANVLKEGIADATSTYAYNLSLGAGIAIDAINALYGTLKGLEKQERIQSEIDKYVIELVDIDLLEARISEVSAAVSAADSYLALLEQKKEQGKYAWDTARSYYVGRAILDYIQPVLEVSGDVLSAGASGIQKVLGLNQEKIELMLTGYASKSLNVLVEFLKKNEKALRAVQETRKARAK